MPTRHGLKNPKLWQAALACYWLALFVGTHLPPSVSVPSPGQSDKLTHFAAYAGLAVLVAITWQLAGGHLTFRHLCWLWIVLLIFAAFDEWTQMPVGRDASVWDWLADVSGALFALALFALWQRGSNAPHE
jgi:VanZ family protein